MRKKKNEVKNILLILGGFLVLLSLPTVGMVEKSNMCSSILQSTESSAEIWVDRGCGGRYRSGDPIFISFAVTSSASKAVVIILAHPPQGAPHYLVFGNEYTTNTVHPLVIFAECPRGLWVLEIQITTPPRYLPPEKIAEYETDSTLFDTCHFHVDPPCDPVDTDLDGYFPPHDCDDTNPLIHPGAEEVCDNKDNDCDGLIDEGCYTCSSGFDEDGDSFFDCEDCDDHDNTVYPRAPELCDGKDNDCDGLVDEGCCICYYDHDRDGYSDCWDCNDNDPAVYPGAKERCDGKDNDCDGFTDEGGWCDHAEIWIERECGHYFQDQDPLLIHYRVCSFAPTATVTVIDYYPRGEPDILVENEIIDTNTVYQINGTAECPVGLHLLIITATVTVDGTSLTLADDCGFYVVNCKNPDWDNDGHTSLAAQGDDCDDFDPAVHPGAPELCDGKDNNCNGFIDEGQDCNYVEVWVDRQCYGYYDDREPVKISFRVNSSALTATVTITDYPPQGAPVVLVKDRTLSTNTEYTITEPAKCAGLERIIIEAEITVEGVPQTLISDCGFYVINCKNPDNDGDGHVSVLVGGDDCDDDDPDIYPGAVERCDEKDNDCDGTIDEPDNDRDGHISAECGGDDCDDFDPAVYPGAEEIYDGKDNDCDGEIDEGIPIDQIDTDKDGYTLDKDCNDSDASMYPGAQEVCNDGKDNDCDGRTDCDDEDCKSDRACQIIDFASIFAVIQKYKYILVGVIAGIAAALVIYLYFRRKRLRIAEEVGPPPEIEEEVPEKKRREPFWRFRAKRKEEEKIEEGRGKEKREETEKTEEVPEPEPEEEITIDEDLARRVL
jgi:hypothetical protein